MGKSLQTVSELWQRMGLVQRILLLTILLACLGSTVLIVNWARRPNMALLFSGLSPEDAAKVVDKVRDAGVPYELSNGGTSVYCPEEKVYALRLSMASQGLPGGGTGGWRILDEEGLGTSPFIQRVNYRRALEGELSRTIQMLDGVAGARVHVAKPDPALFASAGKQVTATVALKLRSGAVLGPGAVAGIVHLVAGSVEGLSADRVVVVDGAGNLLSDQTGDPLAKGSSSFLDYKTRVETYLAHKAEEMLQAALGPDRASVRVHATVETSSSNQTKETYDPAGRVASKEETKSKSSTGGGSDDKSAGGGTKEETNVMEYMVSKTVESRSESPGTIKSLSVAAFVDLAGPPAKQGEAAKPKMAVQDVEDIIRRTLGLSATDTIKVVDTPFQKPAAAQAAEEPSGLFDRAFLLEIARRSSLGILVIGALLAMKIFGGASKKGAAQASLEASPGQPAAMLTAQGSENPEVMRARITGALRENPDQVRQLFLSWAREGQGEA